VIDGEEEYYSMYGSELPEGTGYDPASDTCYIIGSRNGSEVSGFNFSEEWEYVFYNYGGIRANGWTDGSNAAQLGWLFGRAFAASNGN
jgi:hypothetical protein